MTKYIVHADTDYCGTDNDYLIEAKDLYEAEQIGYDIGYDNATMFFDVVSQEDLDSYMEDEDFDDSTYITDEQWSYYVEEYNPKIHDPESDYPNQV